FSFTLCLSVMMPCSLSSTSESTSSTPKPLQLPPSLGATNCNTPVPTNELPNARFVRKGGRRQKATIRVSVGVLTVDGIEQGRDIVKYDRLVLNSKATFAFERSHDPVLSKARQFLWQHWKNRRLGYLTLTGHSVDASSTSHVFVEPDNDGRWRVAWRIVRGSGEIDDLPTYFSVTWVIPAGWREPGTPLSQSQKPDSRKHVLEFRDICGDVEQSL